MGNDTWQSILVVGLAANAALGFGYRVYRLQRGGPMSDVVGQAILGVLLAAAAVGAGAEAGWARAIALVYAVLFGLVVMPVWILAVLIPLRPGGIDVAFTAIYWAGLVAIGAAAVVL